MLENAETNYHNNQPTSVEEIKRSFGAVDQESIGIKRSQLTPCARFVLRICKQYLAQQEVEKLDQEAFLKLIEHVEETEGEQLSDFERTSVLAALESSLDDYDIIAPLLNNKDVNDIIIRSYNDISVQSGRKNIQTDISFIDKENYTAFIERLLKKTGKSCTLATPVVDASLDSNLRLCVTHESFSPPGSGPMLTLRVARHKDCSTDLLQQFGLAPKEIMDYLRLVVQQGDATLLIAGEVGTGKTTLVTALAQAINEEEAILIIEDTYEVKLKRPFVRTLLTREANTEGAGKIHPAMAIHTGMRMAMNRIILGEMRSAEAAEAFIDVCASGHPGMSTIHARSAKDAISRLELFLSRAQGNVPMMAIRKQIANAISTVAYLGIDRKTQKRRLIEVCEVATASDGSVQFSPLYKFDRNSDAPRWKREAGISQFNSFLRKKNLQLSTPGSYLTIEDSEESSDV